MAASLGTRARRRPYRLGAGGTVSPPWATSAPNVTATSPSSPSTGPRRRTPTTTRRWTRSATRSSRSRPIRTSTSASSPAPATRSAPATTSRRPRAGASGQVTRRFPLTDMFGFGATTKPVIAAVNGLAVAGGCEIAMACDFRIAADTAWFGLFEPKRGLVPGAAIQLLPRMINYGDASWMLLTAARVEAADAPAHRARAAGRPGRRADDGGDGDRGGHVRDVAGLAADDQAGAAPSARPRARASRSSTGPRSAGS